MKESPPADLVQTRSKPILLYNLIFCFGLTSFFPSLTVKEGQCSLFESLLTRPSPRVLQLEVLSAEEGAVEGARGRAGGLTRGGEAPQ